MQHADLSVPTTFALSGLLVDDAMTEPVVPISWNSRVAVALAIMSELDVRHVLVGNRDQLLGAACRYDLLMGHSDDPLAMHTTAVPIVRPNNYLLLARDIILRQDTCCAAVRGASNQWGILTRGDILRSAGPAHLPACASCGSYHRVEPFYGSQVAFCDQCSDSATPNPGDEYIDLGVGD